jgi:general secretion pathway protein F
MAAIGETGGRLSEMLFKAAESFEAEIHQNLKTAVSLLEPVLILFIGGIILCIVFAALLPIFQINFLETGP